MTTSANAGNLDLLTSALLIPNPPVQGPHNPTGKNQYTHVPPKGSKEFEDLLRRYHRITTSRVEVQRILEQEHGIYISDRTVARRWREMGLVGSSKVNERRLLPGKVVQLVAEEMALDPAGRIGQNTMKKQIALRSGIHLTRQTVKDVQKLLDPEAAAARNPTAHQIRRVPLTSDGPNDVWCCDGHDKLTKYGFAIWGMRDKFSRKWLGLWVIPNNRIALVVAYLWLTVVRKSGGIPKQTSSDCGTENTVIYGFANALSAAFIPEDEIDKPAHIFLRSVHHIPIERGWLDLRNDFGHNFPFFWEAGRPIYDETNPTHKELAMWLWPPILQKELDRFCDLANNRRVRKQNDKVLPSGVTPNTAYRFPDRFGGENCLQPVDINIVDEILRDLAPNVVIMTDWGVSPELAARAEQALAELHIAKENMTLTNAWVIFSAILNLIQHDT